ncbi:Plasmodium exported protein, unknown function [Plasmodium malariae]|uniref:Fam-h protein n=1 Tax=Plasmodium malariae TaxID=5858 RepID=A0A1D3TDW5_PLAMA|nr:Plasmodium exported protein, unknown function [Plasmodium malariae]SCP03032.1 Plasmodium exported protein, unknown function [Plasmodium malariae]
MGQKRKLMFFTKINVFILLTWICHTDDKMGTINKHFHQKIYVYRILSKKKYGFFGQRNEKGDSNILSVETDMPTIEESDKLYKSKIINVTDKKNLTQSISSLKSEVKFQLNGENVLSVNTENDSLSREKSLDRICLKNKDKCVTNPNNENVKRKIYIKYIFLVILPVLLPLAEIILYICEFMLCSEHTDSSDIALCTISKINVGVMSSLTYIIIMLIIFICEKIIKSEKFMGLRTYTKKKKFTIPKVGFWIK